MYKSSVPVFLRQTASSHQKRISQIRPVRQTSNTDKENKHSVFAPTNASLDQSLFMSHDYTHVNTKQVEKSPSIFKEIFQKSSAQQKQTGDSPSD